MRSTTKACLGHVMWLVAWFGVVQYFALTTGSYWSALGFIPWFLLGVNAVNDGRYPNDDGTSYQGRGFWKFKFTTKGQEGWEKRL